LPNSIPDSEINIDRILIKHPRTVIIKYYTDSELLRTLGFFSWSLLKVVRGTWHVHFVENWKIPQIVQEEHEGRRPPNHESVIQGWGSRETAKLEHRLLQQLLQQQVPRSTCVNQIEYLNPIRNIVQCWPRR
jgi:hypothetical protein